MVKFFYSFFILTTLLTVGNILFNNANNKTLENKINYYPDSDTLISNLKEIGISRDSLFNILNGLKLCSNIKEKEWENYSDLQREKLRDTFQCLCNENSVEVYPLYKNNDSVIIVVLKENHGSGEYDNFVLKKSDKKYKEVQYFKGYIDSVYQAKDSIPNIVCRKMWNYNSRVLVLGKWKNDAIYQDSILNYFIFDPSDSFTNIKMMLEAYSNKDKWDG